MFFFFKIFEYLEDLKYYYDHGYGNQFGERMGCPIVKDLISNFKYGQSIVIVMIIKYLFYIYYLPDIMKFLKKLLLYYQIVIYCYA